MTNSERIAELGKGTENDAYYNLAGAIDDIHRANGRCDTVIMRTLERVASQLARATA